MINQLISSFNAGELSPYLETRTNLEKYRNGCKLLENFLLTPYGPANRRAGLEYRGAAKLSSSRCRLIGVNLTANDRYILELGVGYIRFWKDGNLILDPANNEPLKPLVYDWQGSEMFPQPAIQHPYLESELQEIKYTQINNVVYFVHPNHHPYRLARYSDTNWMFGEVVWAWPPMLDQNVTPVTITPSARTSNAGQITLTASYPIFKESHIGSFWQIDHATESGVLNHPISTPMSANFSVLGKWQIQSFGTWSANISLQASSDNGATWEVRRTYVSRNDYNVVSTGEESQETLFRFVVNNYVATTSASPPRIQMSAIEPLLRGFVKIVSVLGTTAGFEGEPLFYQQAKAIVVKTLGATSATSLWHEGAFSTEQGYPNAIGLHESRLIFAGTKNSPNTLWGSYSNDFQNFRKGSFDADSWAFTLASTTGGRVNWLVSKAALLIGTSLDEWSLSASDSSRPLTSTNVRAQAQSQYGSSNLPALVVNDTILYIQRMARKIRELIYTWSSESWISNDITALAEHTTRTLIREVAYQRVPDAVYWFVRGDGQLVSMTYEREQQVVGFARHSTDGEFESVTSINGTTGEDEVWVSVKRTINNQIVRSIERFKTGMRDALDTGDKSAWFFVDSGVQTLPTYSLSIKSGDVITFSNLPLNSGLTGTYKVGIKISSTEFYITQLNGNYLPITDSWITSGVSKINKINGDFFTISDLTGGVFTIVNPPSLIPVSNAMITGLSHLEGKEVSVWAGVYNATDNEITYGIVTPVIDPATGKPMAVTNGALTLQTPVCASVVGLPYTSLLCPERVDQQMADGTSQSRKMRIPRINIKLYQSFAGEYSSDQVNWSPMVARTTTDFMDDSPPVRNGWNRMYLSSNWQDGVDIFIRQTLPMPLTIAAIVPVWEITEGQN
jgi:hypothetical protein